MSMITATTWVPRGFAAPFPTKYVFDEDEYGRIAKLAKLQLDDAQEDLEEAKEGAKSKKNKKEEPTAGAASGSAEGGSGKKGTKAKAADDDKEDIDLDDDDLREYDLEHYDDEPEAGPGGPGDTMGMFGNIKSLAYHENNEDDPYITLKEDEDDDDDREDLQILGTDNLILAARVEDDLAHLEVYVYEDEADNLYVHHDIMLPAIPLAVEWLDMPVGRGAAEKNGKGSFVAVGTMDPDIEIWDLDTIDLMYPNAILGQGGLDGATGGATAGGGAEEKPKKKKKKKAKKANDEYHVDAVLALAANRQHRNLLASASADQTIKLWDLNTTRCAKSYSYHTDKVCTLAWHPVEATVLLSGSYDRTVVAADMRAPDAKMPRWGVESDVGNVRWDPHDSNYFYVSTDAGTVHYFDARVTPADPSQTKPVWTLQAHDEPVTTFDINAIIPGFLATGSADREVKLWNIQPVGDAGSAAGPSMVVSRNLGVGKVFSTTFAPDAAVGFRLAVAGSKGSVQIWDTSTNAAVRHAFATKVGAAAIAAAGDVKERLVGVEEQDSESDEGEESGEDGGEGGEAGGAQDGWESMEE